MPENKKKFKLIDAILTVICVVFVAEAAAPVAAIGNSQYFWWIFLIIAFLIPYGLIASELGTTYDGEGGLYDWVRKAFGPKWGARVAWFYWINYPLWLASLAVMTPDILGLVFGVEFSTFVSVLLQLLFIAIVVFISFFPASDSTLILNGSAVIKVGLALLLGGLGIYGALTKGVANEYTFSSLLPSLNLHSLSFISVIIFNFLGFEVICTFADDMENPKKQIPQSIIIGGIVIAAIYIISAFGIGVAIPTEEISTSSGLIDSIQLLSGMQTGLFINIVAILFLLTLFGNMISWAFGVNSVARYAALNDEMPKVFSYTSKKNNMPIGAAIMNGIVAAVVVIISPFIPNQDIFWSFFALNLVTLLLSYLPVFPAFLKLRKVDGKTKRPFKVSGSDNLLKLMAYMPMVIIIISLIFVAVPLSFDPETLSSTLPITIGAVLSIIIGEIIILVKKIGSKK